MTPEYTIALMLTAWAIEVIFGWPNWLYRSIRHPVVWWGALVTKLERLLNVDRHPYSLRYTLGGVTTLITVSLAAYSAWAIETALPADWIGFGVQAVIASSLLASRSMHEHVIDVLKPLHKGDAERARSAVSMIVGRDTTDLSEAGIATAALESLAENTSDGVTAPLMWGALFGLPGIAAYKAINTLDSMIGHRSKRYLAFGAIAARLDDAANIIPARVTGAVFAFASGHRAAWTVMWRDAARHASPNAGWPEAAMAGALNVQLGGQRHYFKASKTNSHAWLNFAGRAPSAPDIAEGLSLYRRALMLFAAVLVCTLAALLSL